MNLRDLKYLVAVADLLHFGRAAQACHVSQPTLSMQLKKLEESLGAKLLERSNKQVLLTPLGREVVGRARAILREAEQIAAIAKAAGDPLAGELTLGIFPTLAPYLLPRLMPAIRRDFPRLSLLLVEEKTPEILRRLHSGELDAGLLALPAKADGIATLPLFTEPFLLAAPARHRLAQRAAVTYQDLHKETMLLLDDGHCLRDQALEVCRAIGIGEAQHFRATSLETLRHMVAQGNALTLMPKLAVRDDPAIRFIPFKKPVPSRTIGLAWRAISARTALFEALAQRIRSEIRL